MLDCSSYVQHFVKNNVHGALENKQNLYSKTYLKSFLSKKKFKAPWVLFLHEVLPAGWTLEKVCLQKLFFCLLFYLHLLFTRMLVSRMNIRRSLSIFVTPGSMNFGVPCNTRASYYSVIKPYALFKRTSPMPYKGKTVWIPQRLGSLMPNNPKFQDISIY